jgi:hypothetical protein
VWRAIVLVVALALPAAGCGGGGGNDEAVKPLTKAQYQARLQQLSNQVGAELRQSVGASTTLKQGDVPKLQKSLRSLARKLDGLRPPAAVADLHTRLIAAVGGLADDLPSLAKTLDQAKDPSAALAALFGAKPIQELIQLQQAFKDKGYDISSLLDAGSGP